MPTKREQLGKGLAFRVEDGEKLEIVPSLNSNFVQDDGKIKEAKGIKETNMKLLNFLVVSTILAILLSNSMPARSQEVEDEREFSYESGSEHGPDHWGEIHEDWAACGKGKMQSPIDLANERVQVVHHLGHLRRTYRPANAVMKNRGHDIMLKWEDGVNVGGIVLNGTEYQLRQLHWHSPSEHSHNGRRYALELHMLHESADKKIAVVGIMYKIGRPDTLLAKLEDYVKKLEDEEGEEKVGMVDPREVKWGSRKYFRYMGSLTTPPCTEGVMWSIIRKVRTVSREQIHMLREAVHDESEMNARPKQLINDRMIGLYRPRVLRE